MKNQVEFKILILTGLVFVLSLFPFAYVDGAKFQSGVTITAPTTTPPPAGACPDTNGDGINDMTGAPCSAPTGTAGTCGLEIVSGVPINYGQLNLGQVSAEQKVTYKNVGTATAQIMVKAGDWIGGTTANPIKVGVAEITRVADTAGMEFGKKIALHSSATTLGGLNAGQTKDSFWSMYAETGLSGSPNQEVTLDLTC